MADDISLRDVDTRDSPERELGGLPESPEVDRGQSDYDMDTDGLDEVAAPPPVDGGSRRGEYLEEIRSSSASARRPGRTMSGALVDEEKLGRTSRRLSHLYTVSYLIVFSFLGTLARLGLERLTKYPGAPASTSVLWANVAGSLVMGFLAEDRRFFPGEGPSPADIVSSRKTIPLYIGLSTGFCGSFTSFSSFIRDAFLALANDLPSTRHISWDGGHRFMAFVAVVLLEVGMSLSGLFVGAHLAMATGSRGWVPRIRPSFMHHFLDPLVTVAAPLLWTALVVVYPFIPPGHGLTGRVVVASLIFAPLGCLLRYILARKFNPRLPTFPLGTFIANVTGTMILGMAYSIQHVPPWAVGMAACPLLQGVMDGFCGCLTTVSTWVLELSDSQRQHAYVYGTASVGVALAALVVELGSVAWTVGLKSPVCS